MTAHPITPDDWAHLKAYGYAPGGYLCKCHDCEKVVEWIDKRAVVCRPCAEQRYAADVRELRKWLNEQPNQPIDRGALARVLASLPA